MTLGVQAQPVPVVPTTWGVGSGPWLANDNLARGAAYNPATGHFLIASRTGSLQIAALNAADGTSAGSLNVTGISGGTFPLNLVGASTDGQIFAANLVTAASASAPLKIYRWADEEAAPQVVYEGAPSGMRFGDSFAVWGTGDEVYIYVSGSANTAIAEFVWNGTALSEPRLIPVPAGTARGGIARGAGGNTLWINGSGTTLREIDRQTGALVREIPGTLSPSAYMIPATFTIEGRRFVVSGIRNPEVDADVIDVTTPGQERVVARLARFGATANANATGAIAYDAQRNQLLVFGTNNGAAAYSMDLLLPPVLGAPTWAISAGAPATPWFANDNNTRGGAYNPATDNFIVVSRSGGLNMRIVHAGTGEVLGTMDVTGITGGTFVLSNIGITPDGQIFGANLTVNPETSPVRIYRWRHERARPELVFSGTLPGPRYGDAFNVYGSGNDVDLFVSGSGNDRIARLNWNGETVSVVASLQPQAGQPRGRFGLAPVAEDRMWINSPGHALALINSLTGEILREVSLTRAMAAGYLAAFTFDGRQYVATGPQFGVEEAFVILDVTTPGSEFVSARTPVLGTNANGNASGAASWDFRRNNLLVLGTNNAFGSVSVGPDAAAPAPVASLIVAPPDRASVTVAGDPNAEITVSWTPARGRGTEAFTYRWQLTVPGEEDDPFEVDGLPGPSLTFTVGQLNDLLREAGIEVGQSLTVIHRAVAVSELDTLAGPWSFATFTRGSVVSTDEPALAAEFGVEGLYPNPARGAATLRYNLPAEAVVAVEVYDNLGRRVLRTAEAAVGAGAGRTLALDTSGLAAGVYVWRLTADTGTETLQQTGRMTVVR